MASVRTAACAGADVKQLYGYLEKYGLAAAATFQRGECPQNSSRPAPPAVGVSGRSVVCQSPACERHAFQQFVAFNGTAVAAVYAADWMLYEDGVFSDAAGCDHPADSFVQVVGYTDQYGPSAWILRQSWGPDWGMDGYIMLALGSNVCRVSSLVAVPDVIAPPTAAL